MAVVVLQLSFLVPFQAHILHICILLSSSTSKLGGMGNSFGSLVLLLSSCIQLGITLLFRDLEGDLASFVTGVKSFERASHSLLHHLY